MAFYVACVLKDDETNVNNLDTNKRIVRNVHVSTRQLQTTLSK
jgi:hypothetical protein